MITPDTILPEQILELQSQADDVDDREMSAICECALVGDIEAIDTCVAAINFGADDPAGFAL